MKKITIILLILTNTVLFSQNKELIKETFFNQSTDKIDSIAINNGFNGGEIINIKANFKTDSNGNIFDISVDTNSKIFESEINFIINQIPKLNPNEYLHKGQNMKYGLKINVKLESDNERKNRIKKGKLTKIEYKGFYIKEYFPVKIIEVEETEKNQFINIETIPVSENCKQILDELDLRKCVQNDIVQHVSRKFDSDLAFQLGLPAGIQKIIVKFIISKSGEIVNIEAEGNSEELREEGIRVINTFPNFIKPGTIDGKPVDIKYSIPIAFRVE